MLNNFIGGGQVFLHKVRMLRQVLSTTLFVSLITGLFLAWSLSANKTTRVDWDGAMTFAKAKLAITVHPAISAISIKRSAANVDAYSEGRLWKKRMLASSVVASFRFKSAWNIALQTLKSLAVKSLAFGSIAGICMFLLWSRYGRGLKTETKKEGSAIVLTAKEVKQKLKSMRQSSSFKAGPIPLVKDAETRHFLVTGSTGCGKTNLMHILLPQIEKNKQPAIIIDQTGEMIARYYKPERGDIIFNPFDARSKAWDFWTDCHSCEELERFSKILFSFNRKKSRNNSDPFWEQSAEYVFNACVEHLLENNERKLDSLNHLTIDADLDTLKSVLAGTSAERYLKGDGKGVASSVLSMLATTTKPMKYLSDYQPHGKFSLKEHFQNIKDGSDAWLFLSTKPSSRDLTLPLIACLSELALSQLMEIGINKKRRVWCIFDELASLGNLPALSPLMAEGRKYGACVVAALQSLNQLYDNYGHYAGSSIFGQFGTAFFFRNTEPAIAKLFSDMCGTETITRQQKNTSFGANTFRDGVSYSEQQQKQPVAQLNDLASLAVGECYTLLPEPEVRLSKIQLPEDKEVDRTEGFIPREKREFDVNN
jgi:type IV conjugative transfer system coupling protein TraD